MSDEELENTILASAKSSLKDNASPAHVSFLFPDSEVSEGEKATLSDDADSDDEGKLTTANFESLSRILDRQTEVDAINAQSDLRENALQTNITENDLVAGAFHSEPIRHKNASYSVPEPERQNVRQRMIETVRILGPRSSRTPGSSRVDHRAQLLEDVCTYYGYSPYLAEKILDLFSASDAIAFFDASEAARPVVIRTNTLKTTRRALAQALIDRGMTLEPIGKWSKVGLQVFDFGGVSLAATPEYLAGHYYIQGASSFLPVMALAPEPNEHILDMCAAPGGKSTFIAALLRNTGTIIANDISKSRAKALTGNLQRLGVRNSIVCSSDARTLPRLMPGGFDRVLLDAPCSNTGVICRDPSIKSNKGLRDFILLAHTQKQLLLSAIDSAKSNDGVIVYSTCSVAVEECEAVVQYALNKRSNVRIEDLGLDDFGIPAFTRFKDKCFTQQMRLARRYYPHTYNMDGFFACRLKKTGHFREAKDLDDEEMLTGGEPLNMGNVGVEKTDSTMEEMTGMEDFDTEENELILKRSRRKRLKKEGRNPKADIRKRKLQRTEANNED
ncbi:rRNA (cytosine-C5-)-methyltransferase nop2 [Thelotrema lepadinum]|nr:rRNA (cytosine-C5-)-methyltransferase nop2 [Thelotrema lepadinum]